MCFLISPLLSGVYLATDCITAGSLGLALSRRFLSASTNKAALKIFMKMQIPLQLAILGGRRPAALWESGVRAGRG